LQKPLGKPFRLLTNVSFRPIGFGYFRGLSKKQNPKNAMKKIFTTGIIAGFILLIIGYLALLVVANLLPAVAEEYYSPTFRSGSDRLWMYLAHPFLLTITFAWFWHNFKSGIVGSWWFRGIWVGLIYGAVALLPAMWLTFSSINVSLLMVLSWYIYGLFQAIIAGLIYAKLNP
jgi:hypothetical protein